MDCWQIDGCRVRVVHFVRVVNLNAVHLSRHAWPWMRGPLLKKLCFPPSVYSGGKRYARDTTCKCHDSAVKIRCQISDNQSQRGKRLLNVSNRFPSTAGRPTSIPRNRKSCGQSSWDSGPSKSWLLPLGPPLGP